VSRKSAVEAAKNALWAFGFAIGLWYFADQNVSEEKSIRVRLKIDAPSPGMAVTYVEPEPSEGGHPEVEVGIRGPKSALNKSNESWEEAHFRPKPDVKLNEDVQVRIDTEFRFNWPPEVKLTYARPDVLKVRFVRLDTARAGVEIDLDEATVPPGFEIERSVIPASLLVRAPSEKLEPSLRLKTERIDLLGELARQHGWRPGDRRSPPEIVVDEARVIPPDPAIVPERGKVRVRIALRAKPRTKDFAVKPELLVPLKEAFPFRLEPTVEEITLTLSGPDAVLQELSDPAVLAKRERAVVRIPPQDLPELKKKVGTLVLYPVEVWTDDQIRNLTAEKDLNLKVNEAPATPSSTLENP